MNKLHRSSKPANRLRRRISAALAVAGLCVVVVATPAAAATSTYSSDVCGLLRPAIYGAAVGSMSLSIWNGYPGDTWSTDSWYNATRTTQVKLTNVGISSSIPAGGKATYTGSLTNKGQDCRAF